MLADGLDPIDPPTPGIRVVVVIPARDEADHLPSCLQALADQVGLDGAAVDRRVYEVIILANNCTDATARLARRFAAEAANAPAIHVVERAYPESEAHVGTARKWLMDRACDRLEGIGRDRTLIASTDADTRVGRTWIAAQLDAVDRGADAVAGSIRVALAELRRLGPHVRRAYWLDLAYRRLKLELEARLDPNPLDPHPRHDFHGGASLAITPAMYRRVGGLTPLRSLEDVALTEALWRVDARFVHSPRVRVRTSGRLAGRADGGHSHGLRRWAANAPELVPDVADLEAMLATRGALRRWHRAALRPENASAALNPALVAEMADRVRVAPTVLSGAIDRREPFGLLLERLAAARPDPPPSEDRPYVPIATAIEQLRARLRWFARPG